MSFFIQQAAEEVLEKYKLDRSKVVVLGGSHGGFLAAHLIGQYPVSKNKTSRLQKAFFSELKQLTKIEMHLSQIFK